MGGDRFIMIGDATAFIDPVFSTGVYLAMRSGFIGADTVETCLDRPEHAAAALKRFESDVSAGIGRFSWFIYRITSPQIRNLFMAPRNLFRMKEAVLSLLAGDIASDSPIRFPLFPFQIALLRHHGVFKYHSIPERIALSGVSVAFLSELA